VQVTCGGDPFHGGQGPPGGRLWRQAAAGTIIHSKTCGASDTLRRCSNGLLDAVSELPRLDNNISDQGPVPCVVSKPVAAGGFDRTAKSDTQVCIKASLRASAMGSNNLTGLPGWQPSGPTTTPQHPAGAQWKLADTCKDEPATCAVPLPKLPVRLAPGMPDMPKMVYTTLGSDLWAWQSSCSKVQVGEQIYASLQVTDQS
jgi:hypothetical protein